MVKSHSNMHSHHYQNKFGIVAPIIEYVILSDNFRSADNPWCPKHSSAKNVSVQSKYISTNSQTVC